MFLTSIARRATSAASWIVGARSSTAAFLHTLLARIFLMAINFGTGVLVARNLEAHGRGVQAAIAIWPLVLTGLFTFGIPSALRFRIPRAPKEAEEYLSASLIFSIVMGVAAIAVGYVFVPHWLSRYDAQSIRFAQLLLLFIPGSLALAMVQAYFEATKRFRHSNAIVYGPPASTLVLLVILVAVHRLTPFSSALAYYVPTMVVVIARLWAIRSLLSFPGERLKAQMASLASYGSKAFGIDVLTTLSTQVDQALVIRFLSASELGIYAVALAVSRVLAHFSTALSTVLMPKAAALAPKDAVALVGRSARITLATTACAAAVAAAIAPLVVPAFYGHDFRQAGHVSQVLFAEVTLGSTVTVLSQAFLATGRPTVVTVLQGLGLAAIVPLMIALIPKFGIEGAALALLTSTSLRFVFVLACYPIMLGSAPPNVFLTPEDTRFALSRFRRLSAKEVP